MKIKRIEHVGVVVRDTEASRKLWEGCFGIRLGGTEEYKDRPVKLALYPVGESMVELLSGTTSDSGLGVSVMCSRMVSRLVLPTSGGRPQSSS